ncbi:hypothetical protein ACFOLJ_04320 [Rugamonas sp. CCM 8940]|uniref:hypothetical protein n=1 Tax=Rugamonas sp. CCM 8940 TaxID=2765359 RepID=UPI0018F2E049|nr:hypothetical protein [Rugamonas sp. CCM 8940]MBJ7312140.1 hypothetical protein [Rugamonas sp. CCM 8940]
MHSSILRQLIALPALLAGLAGLYACGSAASQSEAPAAARPAAPASAVYVLATGQSVGVAPGTTLRLDRVNDSRCRQGAACVWAGYISYSLTLSGAAGDSSFVLAEDMPGGVKTQSQNGVNVTLKGVEPAAPAALRAPPPDYRVSLQVDLAAPAH